MRNIWPVNSWGCCGFHPGNQASCGPVGGVEARCQDLQP